MHRRNFLAGLGLSISAAGASASPTPLEFCADGTKFRSWHKDARLISAVTAPTRGWVAVGFNNQQHLKGTRFVIGAMISGRFQVEEHIAVVPDHPRVQELGLGRAVTNVEGRLSGNTTTMKFSLPHLFPDSENPTLLPGTSTFLMLAWSHRADFAHHSAWRRHFVKEI